MAQLFRNKAFSTLAQPLTSVATTLNVIGGHGDRFPEVIAPDFMLLTLQDAANNLEVVKVTGRTAGSDALTIARAQEGSAARAWSIGDVVELRLTAFALAPLGLLEGAATAAQIREKLGASTVGTNLFSMANPNAVTFLRINANNTVSPLTAAEMRDALGAVQGADVVLKSGGEMTGQLGLQGNQFAESSAIPRWYLDATRTPRVPDFVLQSLGVT